MIEDVESLEIKLALHSCGDREVLEQGRICHELTRSDERVAADVAELAKRRPGKWPGGCAVVGQRSNRIKVRDRVRGGVERTCREGEVEGRAVGTAEHAI